MKLCFRKGHVKVHHKPRRRKRRSANGKTSNATFPATLRCRTCGKRAKLKNIVSLWPGGRRGWYACRDGHIFKRDRRQAKGQPRKSRNAVKFRT